MIVPGRGWMMAASLLLLAGCTEQHRPVLVLREAYLATSSARIPLEPLAEPGRSGWAANPLLRVAARDTRHLLQIGVFPPQPSLFVGLSEPAAVEILSDACWYRRHGGDPTPVIARRQPGRGDGEATAHRWMLEVPPPLASFDMTSVGGSLTPGAVEALRGHRRDVHEVQIAYRFDGVRYDLHLAFQLEVETKRVPGVPATP